MVISFKRLGIIFFAFLLGFFVVLISYWFFLLGGEGRLQKKPAPKTTFDLIIRNGRVIDGTGDKGYQADVAITGGMIAYIGNLENKSAKEEIDVSNLIVAPGFINPHSHIDQTILEDRAIGPSLLQGITTEIVGMDGESVLDFAEHFKAVFNTAGIGVNYGSFVGQGSVRKAAIGNEDRALTELEVKKMEDLVARAMEEGAFGLSTGLEYPPGYQTPTWEIARLCKIAQKYGGIYTTHLRNEGPKILSALEEAIKIGKETNAPVNISHIKINGGNNDSTVDKRLIEGVLAKINAAKDEGVEIFADLYPYTTTYFSVNLPLREVFGQDPEHTIYFSKISNQRYLNKSLTNIAREEGKIPADLAKDILEKYPEAKVYLQSLSEESLITFLKKDFTMISVDAPTKAPQGVPDEELRIHPRRYGTYPRVLGYYVREKGILSLEEAIHKMTGLVAKRYKIEKRGQIREGYHADLVIFDPITIKDEATYSKPITPPRGIKYVLVNGALSVKESQLNGMRKGQLVRLGK